MGDLNINVDTQCYNSSRHPKCSIQTIEESGDLCWLPTGPTRVTCHSSTTIDCILSRWHINTDVISVTSSDQFAVFSILNVKPTAIPPRFVTSRSFKHFNIANFQHDLQRDLHNSYIFKYIISSCFDSCNTWELWKGEFLRICHAHAPIVKRRVKTRTNLWFNPEIMDHIYARNYYHKKYLKYKEPYMLIDTNVIEI